MESPKYTGSIQQGTKTIKYASYKHPSNHKPKKIKWPPTIDIQSNSVLKNKSFKSAIILLGSSKHWLFLPPNAPHQTMRNSHPDNTIMMMTKFSLPTCNELNHSLWHCPIYTKQVEHHRPQLKNNRKM